MTPGFIAISIIFGIILLGAVTGIYSGIRRKINLEQWTVAGRGFGLIFVWVLMAGRLTPPSLFLAPADGLIRAARPRVVVGVGAAMILILTKQDPLNGIERRSRRPEAEHRGYRSGQCFCFRASQWARGAAHHGCGRRLKASVRVGRSRWFKASD
jgi:hypothetical protein